MPRTNGDLRRAIMDETRKSLLESGFAGLSMRKIAQAVGCTATSIYLYFENKDALVHALIEEGMELLYAQLQESIRDVDCPQERTRRMCKSYLDFGLQNPEYYEIMFTLHPPMENRFPAEKYRRARRNLDLFAEGLAASQTPSEIPSEHLKTAVTLIWASLHGVVALLLAKRIDFKIDREFLLKQAVDQATALMAGLREDTSIITKSS